ncbi:DNA-binding MarR family transcriptional regulator [Paenarthrobacter nitroguajacolicus]|uniref:Clp protease N-terminal domain-containing protein n=1 Tax=Paenarthrobacter TaxID=1742992 RepID=UPI00285F3B75|nr:Clp protease N-terminal domain-containing protein [Paenarthrobacter nitroguajacolicus]MDR6987398.1 DNA-binding MarR family transcriptional regulator [Paenarthrobacter nitroguajacolicus]
MSKTTRITLSVAAGALALGAGLGATSIATAASTPSPSATSSADASAPSELGGKPGGHGHGRDAGRIATELASKLGVDEAKVTEALKAFREANKPTTPPAEGTEGTRPDPTAQDAALAKSLAESLGVDEAKVTTALEEIRAEGKAERAAALKTKLDKAVTDGKLTQAEADAVTKAVEAGVIGGGGR